MMTMLFLITTSPTVMEQLEPDASVEGSAAPEAADGSAVALAAPAALEAWGQEEGAGGARAEAR